MVTQAPLKVHSATKERIRYLSALEDVSQAEIVDRAVAEYAARHAADIQQGLDRAREALAGGPVATAGYLLGVPANDMARIAGDAQASSRK
jgi:hypothetical protein